MRALVLGCVLVIASPALAGPHKVLVLPLGGTADPATRAAFDARIGELAKRVGGPVTIGDTTFEETAAAVGCDPAAPACAETVRTALGVDELVYGTATTTNGQTTVTLRRSAAESAPRETTTTAATPAAAEPQLAPLFAAPGDADAKPLPPGAPTNHHQRNVGLAYVAGGGAALVIGLALWSSASSRQDEINAHATQTAQDFRQLEDLESTTLTYAVLGDIMVLGGLALGGYGGWVLYQDHKARSVTLTPAIESGRVGLTLGGAW